MMMMMMMTMMASADREELEHQPQSKWTALPKKIETKVLCPMSNSQIWFYKSLLLKDLSLITQEKATKKAGALNNLIMQQRKAANHPFLFPFVEDEDEEASVEVLVGESGKMAVLDMLLRQLHQKGHRVCIFPSLQRCLIS